MNRSSDNGESGLLREVATVWEAHAQADPLWAVLSEPERLGRRWDLPSFLATGVDQIEKSLHRFQELGGSLADSDTALDFGCGVGRLTQPLADHFDRVIGVDISPTMVEAARRLNKHPEKVQYRLNDQPDLALLPSNSVSLAYSHITLQHMEPSLARRYLQEFFRVTKPGGGVIFQIPSHLTDAYLPSDSEDEPVEPAHRLASLSIIKCPRQVVSGEQTSIRVRVLNRSGYQWRQAQSFPLQVGNHWEHRSGKRIHDDGRARLPGRLMPGESYELDILIRAPESPGLYRLKADVVQEGIAWFEDSGGTPAARLVWVRPKPRSRQFGNESTEYPVDHLQNVIKPNWFKPVAFEMHGMERRAVEDFVQGAGGLVLGVDEWITEWVSYIYYVQLAG